MAVPDVESPSVDELAAEFVERQRDGERVTIEQYAKRYPDLADEIRELFPTIVKLEGLKHHLSDSSTGRAGVGLPGLSRLGDFRIVRELGRGGMGIVYEAVQESLRRRVALKVVGANVASSPKLLARFRQEAESAARLHHTNIVPVFGVGEEHGVFFYAMQYIDGAPLSSIIQNLRDSSEPKSLAQVVAQCAPSKAVVEEHPSVSETIVDSALEDVQGPLLAKVELAGSAPSPRVVVSPAPAPRITVGERGKAVGKHGLVEFRKAARMAADIADALDYAHLHGVLHRDVKPSNVLIDRDGTAWITDFGLAKHEESEDLTLTGDVIGTLRYMAPEQLHGQSDVRSDVYSLGLTLYELLAGQPAFDDNLKGSLIQRKTEQAPPPLRTLNSRIPKDLETVVQKACAPLPADRYQTAFEFSEDLHRFVEERPIQARRMPIPARALRWMRRNPVVSSLSVLAGALVVAVAAAVAIGNHRTNQALEQALSQQQLAEHNLARAIEALKEITHDISSRGVPQSLEITTLDGEESIIQTTPVTAADAELLTKLLHFFGEFAASNETDLTAETAKIHLHIGEIRHRLGQFQEAEADFMRAIQTYQALAAGESSSPDVTIAVAETWNRIGMVRADRAQIWGAQVAHNTARRTIMDSPAAMQADAGQFTLARTYTLYHQVMGRAGVADLFARSGSGRGNRGRRGDGSQRSGDGRQGQDRENRSENESDARDPEGGEPDSGAGGDDQENGIARDGAQPERTGEDGDNSRSDESERRGAWSELWTEIQQEFPPDSIRRAISILEDLVERNPENEVYLLALAQSYRVEMVRARFDRSEGSDDDVVTAATRAIELLEGLTVDYSDDPQYRFELADTLCMSVRFERDLSIGEETGRVERASAICDELIRAYPQVSSYQALSAVADRRMASIHRRNEEPDKAVESYSHAADTYRQLTQGFPRVSIYQIAQAQTLSELADTVDHAGDRDRAFEYAVEAVVVAENCRHLRGGDHFFRGFLMRLTQQRDRLARGSRDERSPEPESNVEL